MRYTHITMSGRHRVLFNGPEESRFVTTTGTIDDAKTIASALEIVLADLPNHIDSALTALLGIEQDLDVEEGVHSRTPDGFNLGWDPYEWERGTLAADKVAPTQLVRRTLSWLVNPTSTPPVWSFAPLAAALAGQPDGVTRAVRDEVALQLAPYDTVPVVGVAYDRKYDDVRSTVCLNAGLETLTTEQLDELTDGRWGDTLATGLLDRLENAGLGDFSYTQKVADQGYLNVAVHHQLLAAWRAATGR